MANLLVTAASDAVLDNDFEFWALPRVPRGSVHPTEIDIPSHGKISVAKVHPGNAVNEIRRYGAVDTPETVTMMIPEGMAKFIVEWHEELKDAIKSRVGGRLSARGPGGRAISGGEFRLLGNVAVYDLGILARQYQFGGMFPIDIKPGKLKGSNTPEAIILTIEFSIETLTIIPGVRVQ